MNAPDGTLLVWCGHWWGLKQVQRACGPHIFPRILKMKNAGLKHFFLGDIEGTLVALTKNNEGIWNRSSWHIFSTILSFELI